MAGTNFTDLSITQLQSTLDLDGSTSYYIFYEGLILFASMFMSDLRNDFADYDDANGLLCIKVHDTRWKKNFSQFAFATSSPWLF